MNLIIFITGCSSGIGFSTAKFLASKDFSFRVITSARNMSDVMALRAAGFEALQLDLSSSESIRLAVADFVILTQGKIDVLFNNAAFGQPGAVEDLSRDALRNQFETNFFGTHELTNLILPLMRSQGHGKIIYNSSVLGFVAMKYRGAYNSSKFALEGLVDTLRLEFIDTNIYFSLIEPGPIESSFRKNAFLMYKKYILPAQSVHKSSYDILESRLQLQNSVAPFTLPADSVAKKVLKIIHTQSPKPRYYVTVPTYVFGFLKRILPITWLDFLLSKV